MTWLTCLLFCLFYYLCDGVKLQRGCTDPHGPIGERLELGETRRRGCRVYKCVIGNFGYRYLEKSLAINCAAFIKNQVNAILDGEEASSSSPVKLTTQEDVHSTTEKNDVQKVGDSFSANLDQDWTGPRLDISDTSAYEKSRDRSTLFSQSSYSSSGYSYSSSGSSYSSSGSSISGSSFVRGKYSTDISQSSWVQLENGTFVRKSYAEDEGLSYTSSHQSPAGEPLSSGGTFDSPSSMTGQYISNNPQSRWVLLDNGTYVRKSSISTSTLTTTTTTSRPDRYVFRDLSSPENSDRDVLILGGHVLLLPTFEPLEHCRVFFSRDQAYSVTTVIGGKMMNCAGGKNYNKMSSKCRKLEVGNWTAEPNMKRKRFYAAASTTKDGEFIVTGGWNETGGDHTSTEIFKNGTWQEGPELPFPMSQHCQVTTEAGVVVAGTDWKEPKHFFVFRLEGQEWIKLIEKEWRLRTFHECQMLDDDRLSVLGGRTYDYEYKERFDILDLKSLTWSKGPNLPSIRKFVSTVYENTLYLIERHNGNVWSFSQENDSGWKQVLTIGKLYPKPLVSPAPILKLDDVYKHNCNR